jgi:DNA-binding NarL/FixJ family response regulator
MRIVIAEDAAIMRDGLTAILVRRGHDVAAAVGDAAALLQAVGEHRPDVAVIDVRMPPTHTDEGLRAAAAIRQRFPGTGVLVFSQYIEAHAATELLSVAPAGVGYLLKDRVADVSDFIDALIRVAEGGTVLDPEVVAQKVVEKHVANIFDKLGLAPSDSDNRRVLAAVKYLGS